MATKTRAAIKAEHGAPLLVDEIEIEDPGDDEVLIKLFATGICHSQLHQIHNPLSATPLLLGHEGTGVVLKAGSKVMHVREGERVMIQFVPRDLPDGETAAAHTTFRWRGDEFEAGVYTWAEPALGDVEAWLRRIGSAVEADHVVVFPVWAAVASAEGT